MKATTLITLGALIGTCTFAVAEDKPKRPDGPKREMPAEMFEKFDADKDGKLSDDERKAMREAMKAQAEERKAKMLEKYDADKDGELSDTEKEAMKADMQARHKALLEKYDADKDGKLSREEVKAARDAGEELPPMMGRGPGGPGGKRGPGGPGGPPPAPAPPAE
jgi:Ca2+-binding EF-hand superfamily protein